MIEEVVLTTGQIFFAAGVGSVLAVVILIGWTWRLNESRERRMDREQQEQVPDVESPLTPEDEAFLAALMGDSYVPPTFPPTSHRDG